MSIVNDEYREVNFGEYCATCKYKLYPEEDDICTECLATPTNNESSKPVNYKPLDSNENPEKYEKKLSKEETDYLKSISHIFKV